MFLGESVNKILKCDRISLLGLIIILLWVSHIPYLFEFPLRSTHGIKSLARELVEAPEVIKREAGLAGKSEAEIERNAIFLSRVEFVKSLLFYSLGILSGILVLQRRNLGRLLTIGVFAYLLIVRTLTLFHRGEPLQTIYWKYTVFFSEYPLRVIHVDILTGVIALISILHLLRPGVAEAFRIGQSDRYRTSA